MAETDDELDALLARGRLSAPEKERMLERLLAGAAPPRRRWRALFPIAGLATAAAAVTLVLLAGRDGFRARGEGGGVLEVGCRTGARDRCPSGELLLFRVSGVDRPAWLAAWAEPASGGERVWYFPTANAAAPRIEPRSSPQVLSQGVRLGPSQPPGRYQVKLLLLPAPPTRESVATAQSLSASAQSLEVTP
jgi:hypothetical protein